MANEALKQSNAWKWWLAGVLFLATVLTYLDRQTLSLCGPMICKEFNLSNEQYGTLVAAFRWAYAFTHIPAGWIADHLPIRLFYALAVGVWSAAGAAAAFVFGFRPLQATRALLGIGEGFNWPCATRIVANMLPPEDRGLASGIFNSGAAAGSLVAPLIITPIAMHFGWRWAFFLVGMIGCLWIVLWMAATGKRSRAYANVMRSAAPGGLPPSSGTVTAYRQSVMSWMREVLIHPAFLMLFIVAITVNPCWYFLNEWIPKYMHDQRGLGFASAGIITVPIFLAADLGNILSGGAIKLLTLRGWSLRRVRGTILFALALLIMPVALVPRIGNPFLAIGLLACGGFGMTAIVANYTACQQDFSFANVGIVAGILGMSSNVFAALANPRIGHYVDTTHSYNSIFLLAAFVPSISVGAIIAFDALIAHRRKRTEMKGRGTGSLGRAT